MTEAASGQVTFTEVPATEGLAPQEEAEPVARPRARRTFTDEDKAAIVAEAAVAKGNGRGGVRGVLVAHGITFPQLARWRRDLKRVEKDSRLPARFRVRRAARRVVAGEVHAVAADPILSELERMAEEVCRRTLKRVLARLCGEGLQP